MSLNIVANGQKLALDANGNLLVNVAVGSFSVSSGQGAPNTTANAWPVKITDGVNLVTVASLASSKALAVEIVDGSGVQITSFGGGTQFADNAVSGATPTGTLSMGWDSVNSKIRALKVDASQNLNVAIASSATLTISGTVTANQGGAPWSENITQIAGAAIGTAAAGILKVGLTDGSGNAITSTTSALDVNLKTSSITLTISGTVTANAGTGTFNNQQSNITVDYDTGVGVQTMTMFGLALPASGGAVAGGTSTNPLQISLANTGANATAVKVDGSGVTQPVSGTITANQGGAPWSQNITQIAGVAIGTAAAGILKVGLTDGSGNAITSSASALDVNLKTSSITLTVSGTFTANQGGAPWSVVGNVAQGLATTGAPILMGGTDGTNVQYLGVDVNGRMKIIGTITSGTSTINTNYLPVAPGWDGTHNWSLKVTTAGVLLVDGSAVTQPVSGSVSILGSVVGSVAGTSMIVSGVDSAGLVRALSTDINGNLIVSSYSGQSDLMTSVVNELRSIKAVLLAQASGSPVINPQDFDSDQFSDAAGTYGWSV